MKLNARHLTADFYNCKNNKLKDIDLIESTLRTIAFEANFKILSMSARIIERNHHDTFVAILEQGHISLHVYPELKYVASDIYLCEEAADPETIARGLRKFFKPDKMKTTLLKRGDFGSPKELRPRVKTHVAPLRRIHNTGAKVGAKVIRVLARRKHNG